MTPTDLANIEARLTRKQRSILACMLAGMTCEQLADANLIAPRTAKNHKAAALEVYGLRTQTELQAVYLRAHGVIA